MSWISETCPETVNPWQPRARQLLRDLYKLLPYPALIIGAMEVFEQFRFLVRKDVVCHREEDVILLFGCVRSAGVG